MAQFTIGFDFTSSTQKQLLQYLQQNNYSLIGFKGAQGPRQVAVGVPAWFSVPFGNIFGTTTITYEPKYKVYVFNQAQIAAQTTIQMQSLSNPVPLGSALTFEPTGNFTTGGVNDVPSGTIGLYNNRPPSTPNVTVGLAGLVNTAVGYQYLPFCAFTLPPQNAIMMTPLEQVLLVAAQLDLTSGNVQANLTAPGAAFAFSTQTPSYPLMIEAGTYGITPVPGGPPVVQVNSGATVALINQPLNADVADRTGAKAPLAEMSPGVISR